MLGMVILKLALAACVDGSIATCTLPNCASAHKECVGVSWEPCTCDVPAGCVNGSATACTLAGCAAAQSVCTGGVVGACQCAIQSCDDGNVCTTDALAGAAGSYYCTHTPRTGVACSDGDICNGAETCSAGGACLPGTPPDLNAGDPGDPSGNRACTYDYCDAAGVHHEPMASCPASGDGAEAGASPGVAPNPLAQPVPQMDSLPRLEVVENTGEVRYRYEFPLPAARGRYQPGLWLSYSSTSTQNQGYGHGWSLSTSFVELSTQGGPYQLFLGGQPVALVAGTDGKYRPEIGVALVSLTPTPGGAGWVGVDAVGNTYTFDTWFGWDGLANGGRWYLRAVVDVDGNKTVYSYQRESGPAAFLTDVSYNNYVAGGVERFAHSVTLTYLDRPTGDVGTPPPTLRWAAEVGGSYASFSRTLAVVTLRAMSSSWANLRAYGLAYTNLWKANPGRPVQVVLSSITPVGATNAALPATSFQYDDPAKPGYALDATPRAFAAPMGPFVRGGQPYAGQTATSMWLDLDGDGLLDRVGNAAGGGLAWARNTTVPGSSSIAFAPVAVLPGSGASSGVPVFSLVAPTLSDQGRADHAALSDMDGDGLPDLVQDAAAYGATSCAGLQVRFARIQNGQLGYLAPTCFVGPTWVGMSGNYFPSRDGSLSDGNFDGASDFVSNAGTYYATGAGFSGLSTPWGGIRGSPATTPPAGPLPQVFAPTDCHLVVDNQVVDMALHPEAVCSFEGDPRELDASADLNGDGIPESIARLSNGDWVVHWGTGSGGAAPMVLAVPAGVPGDFVASRPEQSAVACECSYLDGSWGWKIASGGLWNTYWGWEAGFIDLNGDGIADYVTNAATWDTSPPNGVPDEKTGTWTAHVGQLPPTLLRSVTTGAGATAAITYALASTFKAGPRQGVPWMATSLTISGPRLPSATSYYWYAEPKGGQTWYLPLKYEPRGFARTWVYDGATKLVRETTWATGSHVFSGSPTRISWGTREQPLGAYDPAQPPTGYIEFRRAEFTFAAKARGSTTCTDSATEPSAGSYPVIPVTTLSRTRVSIKDLNEPGVAVFSSQRTVACADADDYGNTLLTTIDPDTAVSGDEVYELAAFDGSATCKSCPVSVTTANYSGGTPPSWLSRSEFLYDSPLGTWSAPLPQGQAGKGHLAFVRRYSSMTNFEVASATIYNANGTVASRIMDPYAGAHARSWTEAYTYDAQGLRITKTRVSDAGVALVKDAGYDSLGQLVLEQGPYVEGTTQAKPTRAYAYDGFGRILAVGRSVSGSQMLGTIAAAEYVDSSPPAVRSYSFLAPQTITIGVVPTRPDVKQVVTHLDGLGRVVEVRERLGVAGTLDPTARITQTLSGYRVAQSVKYDATGRLVASLEPQLRPNTPTLSTEAYEGFDRLDDTANLRGTMTLFDAQGRVSCSMAGVYTALVSTGAACTSSLDENVSFRVATPYAYGAATVNGRAMATARAAPPAKSAIKPAGTTAYYRADGLLDFTSDHYGNTAKLAYDLLGRSTSLTRTAAGKPATAQATTKTYDLLGRVTQEWDPNWSPGSGANSNPSRLYEYDAVGRAHRVRLTFDPTAMARPELRYEYKSLGRRTKAYAVEPSLVVGGLTFTNRTIADLTYDTPYQGVTTYTYVAGRLSSMASPLTTIALGYDQNGRNTLRNQWLTGLTGAFTATGSFADDGRLLSASFASTYSATATWTGSYDSAGRPVKVGLTAPTALAAALWEAPLAGTASPYDALDRVGTVKSNGGLVTTTRTYATWSGQVTGHWVMANGTQAYGVDALVYAATKLKHVHDRVTNGVLDYSYDANGRLATATAAGGTGTLAQSYSQGYSFSDAAWPAGATVGNLERVTASGVVTHYDYLQDRLVSTSNAAGATLTTNLHDHAGRLTSKRTAAGAETEGFAYDIQDQLRQVKRSGVVTEKLEYDPTGAPLFRMVGSQVVYYVGPFATVTATANAGCTGYGCPQGVINVKAAAHVILAGGRIATVRASNVLYYHRDWQGSVVATTYTGGNVGVKYRYTPYGQLDRTDESISNVANASELGYTGGLRLGWNPSTGARQGDLLLLGARVYDAALKRWLQPDTVDVLRYTYTSGDPVNLVDPTGREPVAPTVTAREWYANATGQRGPVLDGLPGQNAERCGGKDKPCDLEEAVVWSWKEKPTVGDRQAAAAYAEQDIEVQGYLAFLHTRARMGRFGDRFSNRFWQNMRMTSQTVMSPFKLAYHYVGLGERPGLGQVALGLATWKAFSYATGAFLTEAGVPTVAGVLEAHIVSNAGLMPEFFAVAGEGGAVVALRAGAVGFAAAVGIVVGSAVEALGYAVYRELSP